MSTSLSQLPWLTCTPTLFPGAVANWPALKLWDGPSGISRLTELAGDVPVEIMVSPAENFRGDMENLVLLTDKLSSFLNGSLASSKGENAAFDRLDDKNIAKIQFYLAQSPIASVDYPTRLSLTDDVPLPPLPQGPLFALMQDIAIPVPLLEGKIINAPQFKLESINFWGNIHSQATSSLHYDLYNNLLCVVTGQKTVRLLAPKATKFLRNVAALYAESANHANDDLFNPERKQELEKQIKELENQNNQNLFLEFVLNPGDALFLPEGWWHQVSSTSGTTAVNFWWSSSIERSSDNSNIDIMLPYFDRCQARLLLPDKKLALLMNACREASQLYPSPHRLYTNAGLDTPLIEEEREFMLQLKQSLEAVVQMKHRPLIEVIVASMEKQILALLSWGPLSFIRVLLTLKREYPGIVAVLFMEVDSARMWEAFTTGLETRVTQDYFELSGPNWVDKAGGSTKVLSCFYDEMYSDVGCDRKAITPRMVALKEEYAKEAYQTSDEALRYDKS